MKLILALVVWMVCGTPAQAQVPKPPPRSKDNHHQASAPQHPELDVAIEAWIDCLLPHVGDMKRTELRYRLSAPLQNQYPEHAAFDFYQALIDIVQSDLCMSGPIRKQGGEALLAGGPGIDRPLVDDLLRRVFDTSKGVLRFRDVWQSGDSLKAQIARVLEHDPAAVQHFARAGARELTKEQQWGLRELQQRYVSCLLDYLPVEVAPKSKTRFRDQVLECFLLGFVDRAEDGLRSRVRSLVRPHFSKGRRLQDARECVEMDAFLREQVDALLPEPFWETFRGAYQRALDEPETFRKELDDWTCADLHTQGAPEEDSDEPGEQGSEELALEEEETHEAGTAEVAEASATRELAPAASTALPLAAAVEAGSPLARARQAYATSLEELTAALDAELVRLHSEEPYDERDVARDLRRKRLEAERDGLREDGRWPPSLRSTAWTARLRKLRAALSGAYESERARARAVGDEPRAVRLTQDEAHDTTCEDLAGWRDGAALVGESGARPPWKPIGSLFVGASTKRAEQPHAALIADGIPAPGESGYAIELLVSRVDGAEGFTLTLAALDGQVLRYRIDGSSFERGAGKGPGDALRLLAHVHDGYVRLDLDGATLLPAIDEGAAFSRESVPTTLELRPEPDATLKVSLRWKPLGGRAHEEPPERTGSLELTPRPQPEEPTRRKVPRNAADALRAGLDWLAQHQGADGSWDCDDFGARCRAGAGGACEGPGASAHDVGVSALAVLAFSSAGAVPGEGADGAVVERGLAWLLERQQEEGLLGENTGTQFLYDHSIALLALCEGLAREENANLRAGAQAAVDYLETARSPGAGWRYEVPPKGESDTSVTGWALLALHAARSAGLRVSDAAFEGGLAFLQTMIDPATGRIGYLLIGSESSRIPNVNDDFPAAHGEALTAEGLLCLLSLRDSPRRGEMLTRHASLILKKPPRWEPRERTIDEYYWYFGTLAMQRMGGANWKAWRDALHEALLPHQERDPTDCAFGSWPPVGPWGFCGGRVYSTALACMDLAADAGAVRRR